MKFRFIITNTMDGNVRGTNDEEVARDFAQGEDFFVVDVESGTWLTTDGDEEIAAI